MENTAPPNQDNLPGTGEDNKTNPPQPPSLNLPEVLEKEPTELSEDERNFLTEKQEDLSDEQLIRYNIQRKLDIPEPVKPPEPKKTKEPPPPLLEEEEEVAPEDKRNIQKIVQETVGQDLSEIKSRIGLQTGEAQINNYILTHPEYAGYHQSMLNFVKANPAIYGKLTPDELRGVVARNELEKVGARKEREAHKKAERTKTLGSSVRTGGGGKKDWDKMTDQEYMKERESIFNRE